MSRGVRSSIQHTKGLLSGRPAPEILFDAIERFRPTLFFSVPGLRAFCEKRLHGFKRPQAIEFVKDLPRTATGKIQRFNLRQAP